jgi:hypothetical protein
VKLFKKYHHIYSQTKLCFRFVTNTELTTTVAEEDLERTLSQRQYRCSKDQQPLLLLLLLLGLLEVGNFVHTTLIYVRYSVKTISLQKNKNKTEVEMHPLFSFNFAAVN